MSSEARPAATNGVRRHGDMENPMAKLSDWMTHLRNGAEGSGPAQEMSALMEELQVSYKELRVAEEELLQQHEEVLHSQQLLEAERRRYQELFNLAPDGYVVTDVNGTIREANLAAINMLGVKHKHLVGKPLVGFILEVDRNEFRIFLRDALAGKRREWRTALTPRSEKAVQVAISVARGGAQEQNWLLRWLLRDITDTGQAERQLHDSHQMLHALVFSSPLAVCVLDSNDKVTLWNPAAERLFGWMAAEVMNQPLPTVPEERRDEFAQMRQQSREGIQHRALETQRHAKDGGLLDIALWTSPLKSLDGVVTSVMVVMADITERRRAEELRRQLHQRVLAAQEEERRRISRELHDHLGQQLTAILLGLKNLKDEGNAYPGADRRGTAEKIDRIYELVDNAMRESHHLAWELRPTALDDLGLEVALERYLREWADSTGVRADFQSFGFDNDRLSADLETTLYRVAQEALTNISRHAQASLVSITLDCNRHQGTLVVEDDGAGFDAPSKEAGSRLGLTGMRERLALVNGTLEIESEPGQGTSVFARVPRLS